MGYHYHITVIAVDLESGERTSYPSIQEAASHCYVSAFSVRRYMQLNTSFHQWYWCRPDNVDEAHILQLQRRWQVETRPARKSPATMNKGKKQLFPLRIDAHTIIYVPQDKCTPEYAETYRKKLLKAKSKIL